MQYEKVSVNIDDRSLVKMDLLIDNNFYSNRSEFINEAINTLINENSDTIDKIMNLQESGDIICDNQWFIGISNISKEYLERAKKQNVKMNIKGFGILCFDKDVTPELVYDTIESISKKISVRASDEIRDVLGC